jgi:hypothetical protein
MNFVLQRVNNGLEKDRVFSSAYIEIPKVSFTPEVLTASIISTSETLVSF